ncbi:MAG: hypothetical protein U1E86_28530 [Burkholderiaceae bacterium]
MKAAVTDSIYMYSITANNGTMTLRVDFEVGTNINTDQILAQDALRPCAVAATVRRVQQYGVTIKQSTTAPLALFPLYSPNGTYDALFLTNYAYININDPMTRASPASGRCRSSAPVSTRCAWAEPSTRLPSSA